MFIWNRCPLVRGLPKKKNLTIQKSWFHLGYLAQGGNFWGSTNQENPTKGSPSTYISEPWANVSFQYQKCVNFIFFLCPWGALGLVHL